MLHNKFKILSWNVNRDNRLNLDLIQPYFLSNYDLLCFQEVSTESLSCLQSLFGSYHCFISPEFLHSLNRKREYYLVTFIRKNIDLIIQESRTLPIESVRTRLYKLSHREIEINYTQIIITLNGLPVTIVNCHLQYAAPPRVRQQQLNAILSTITTEYFIIVGDINSFSNFPLSLLIGWLFDYSLSEYILNEQSYLLTCRDFYAGKQLNTTIYHTGKLDYILLSKKIISKYEYLLPRLGSDHYPLVMECEI